VTWAKDKAGAAPAVTLEEGGGQEVLYQPCTVETLPSVQLWTSAALFNQFKFLSSWLDASQNPVTSTKSQLCLPHWLQKPLASTGLRYPQDPSPPPQPHWEACTMLSSNGVRGKAGRETGRSPGLRSPQPEFPMSCSRASLGNRWHGQNPCAAGPRGTRGGMRDVCTLGTTLRDWGGYTR
jgi:hypothetical protein